MATVYSLLCENGQAAGSYFDLLSTSEKARYGSPGSYRCYGSIADWYNDRKTLATSVNNEYLEIADSFDDTININLLFDSSNFQSFGITISTKIKDKRTGGFHFGSVSSGYRIIFSTNYNTLLELKKHRCVVDGIRILLDGQNITAIRTNDSVFCKIINNIITESSGGSSNLGIGSQLQAGIIANNLVYNLNGSGDIGIRAFDYGSTGTTYNNNSVINCTIGFRGGSYGCYGYYLNNLVFGCQTNYQTEPNGGELSLNNAGEEHAVADEIFTSSHDNAVDLAQQHIQQTPAPVVTTSDGATTYAEGTDYTIDYPEGQITVLSSGAMLDATDYLIDYTWRDAIWGTDQVVITSDDFVDSAGSDFRPAEITSSQVDAGVEVQGSLNMDISDAVRPNYSAGEAAEDKWDIGCYEFDSGHGLAPINVRVKITALDVYDSTPINDAMVLLETDTGGPAPAGEDIIKALTGADGSIINDQYLFSGDQPVTGRIRKASTPPYYKTAKISGTITASGLDLKIFMIRD